MHPAKLLREHTVPSHRSLAFPLRYSAVRYLGPDRSRKDVYIYILKRCPLARRLFLLVALKVVVVVVIVVSRCGCADVCLAC